MRILRRLSLFGALALALGMMAPALAKAQVGHAPGRSPYRDITAKYILSFVGGYTDGGGGNIGVGPSTGYLGGLRLDLHLGGPGNARFNLNYGSLERALIDPDAPLDERNVGTVQQSVIMLDAGLDLVLTGAKTWYGLAPYAGASLGIAFGGSVPADSLGFSFSTKFVFGPQIGIRFHPFNRVMLRVEGRDLLWQLSYPSGFFDPPERDPTAPSVLNPLIDGKKSWTHNPQLVVSLGFAP
jgi:hypothetical protein